MEIRFVPAKETAQEKPIASPARPDHHWRIERAAMSRYDSVARQPMRSRTIAESITSPMDSVMRSVIQANKAPSNAVTAEVLAGRIFVSCDVQIVLFERVAAATICVRTIPALPADFEDSMLEILREDGAVGIRWIYAR